MTQINLNKSFSGILFWEEVRNQIEKRLEETGALPVDWRLNIYPTFVTDEFGEYMAEARIENKTVKLFFHPNTFDAEINSFVEANILDVVYQIMEEQSKEPALTLV
ncbi:MAG: hypothetical protein KMY50_00545 [Candidatus Desulforudis sp.]|nr:hypothetical protein [Desulforudis sp.]